MKLMAGVGASFGIGIGPAMAIPARVEVKERRIDLDRVAAELKRLESAVDAADAQLAQASDEAVADGESAHSDFVELHRSMLRFDLAGETGRVVREQQVAAEWAVRVVVREMSRLFAEASEARIAAGLDDFSAVADRLLRVLLKMPEQRLDATAAPGAIGIAVELSPLDILQLRRAGVSGIVTERGGPTSHTAIVARDMEIPYVFGVPGLLVSAAPGDPMCIDGKQGSLVIAPDELTLRDYQDRRERVRARRNTVGLPDPRAVRMPAVSESLSERTSILRKAPRRRWPREPSTSDWCARSYSIWTGTRYPTKSISTKMPFAFSPPQGAARSRSERSTSAATSCQPRWTFRRGPIPRSGSGP
jgi:phosphoenolpyruvate-protein kinase (PTS system EI component)